MRVYIYIIEERCPGEDWRSGVQSSTRCFELLSDWFIYLFIYNVAVKHEPSWRLFSKTEVRNWQKLWIGHDSGTRIPPSLRSARCPPDIHLVFATAPCCSPQRNGVRHSATVFTIAPVFTRPPRCLPDCHSVRQTATVFARPPRWSPDRHIVLQQ